MGLIIRRLLRMFSRSRTGAGRRPARRRSSGGGLMRAARGLLRGRGRARI